jgi:hypothetical protein
MADRVEIRVLIKPDGTVEMETHGLTGEDCVAETKDLEKALGRVTRRTKTSEYHAAKAGTKATVRRG